MFFATVVVAWLPRPPALLSQPPALRSAIASQRPARFALMCAEAGPLVGGKPVSMGDGILHRDEESNAWWRATVKDVDGSKVLVSYSGCSDEFDIWVEASSVDLMLAEQGGVRDSAFQSEEYEESLDDEELLNAMRERKWAENARWQLNVFAQEQLGECVEPCADAALGRPPAAPRQIPKRA